MKKQAPVTSPVERAVAGVSSREATTTPKRKPTAIKPRYPVITPTASKHARRAPVSKKTESFDEATLEHFKKILLEKRDALKEQAKIMREEALHRNEDDNPEEDAGTFSRSTDLHRAEEINKQLRAIDDALRAIQDGTYGVCTMCNCLIPRERLYAAPFAIRCVECKKKYEADVALDKRNQSL